MSSLAEAYREAARVQDAVPLLAEAAKLSEAKLGANHIDTLTSMASLADAHREAGRVGEARSLFESQDNDQKASEWRSRLASAAGKPAPRKP
jgi:HD superfamily phosphodiesterase